MFLESSPDSVQSIQSAPLLLLPQSIKIVPLVNSAIEICARYSKLWFN